MLPRSTNDVNQASASTWQAISADFVISLNIWGRGDPAKDDEPAHWGITVHKVGAEKGQLYHVRKHDDFFFESHLERLIETQSSWGRSELDHISSKQKDDASSALHAYGCDKKNIPKLASGANCQDFVIGAIGMLEGKQLLPKGSGQFWASQRGRGSDAIASSLQDTRRSWVPARKGPKIMADATWGVGENRPTGRLNMAAFGDLTERIGTGTAKATGQGRR